MTVPERVSECRTCPPDYVVRCAHWGDRAACLFEGTAYGPTNPRFRVVLGTFSHPPHVIRFRGMDPEYEGNDYDAALEAFYGAERELLEVS